jgi:hypothetical protein
MFPLKALVHPPKFFLSKMKWLHLSAKLKKSWKVSGLGTKLFRFLYDWPSLLLFWVGLSQASLPMDIKYVKVTAVIFFSLFLMSSFEIFSSSPFLGSDIFPFIKIVLQNQDLGTSLYIASKISLLLGLLNGQSQ